MMAVPHARKWRDRQRRATRQRWLLTGGILLLLVLFLARHKLLLRHPGSSGGAASMPGALSAIDIVRRRSLQKAALAGASLDAWRLAVLVPAGAGPEWQRPRLQAALEKVVRPLVLDWHTGERAGALAQYFGVELLPGAVLVPPYCKATECEAPAVWQRRKQTAAAPAEELSAWIVDVSSAWLLLANDATETVKFTRRLPGSSPADSGADSGTDGGGEADGAAAPSNANEQTLEAGGRQWVRSPFQATWTAALGTDGNGQLLAQHVVVGDAILTARQPGECNFFTDPGCELQRPNKQFPEKTLLAREEAEVARLADIRNQSSSIRHYTPRGFEKRRAPAALFHSLHSYFQAHAANYSKEDWDDEDIFVNHDKAQFLLIDIPELGPMRPAIFAAVQPVFEAWAGGIPLTATAIYGVRVYTRGCELRDHVDVMETHHVSAIVNVDQDVDELWPLEIIGHDGKTHQAELRPGDMLLYEGASCAHGRPTPLNGNWMANIFIHFAPAPGG